MPLHVYVPEPLQTSREAPVFKPGAMCSFSARKCSSHAPYLFSVMQCNSCLYEDILKCLSENGHLEFKNLLHSFRYQEKTGSYARKAENNLATLLKFLPHGYDV